MLANTKQTQIYTNIFGDIKNIEEKVNSMKEHIDGIWTCNFCGENTKNNNSGHMKDHVSTHIGIKLDCKICGKTYSSKLSLKGHYYSSHKQL